MLNSRLRRRQLDPPGLPGQARALAASLHACGAGIMLVNESRATATRIMRSLCGGCLY
ncbi:MAG: hypothetical protein ACOCUY_03030 [Verrucomicrobiota bacterium]